MKLVSVYAEPEAAKILYALLAERKPEQNISHKTMPSWEEHVRFVRSKPYNKWFLIEDNNKWLGAIYVTSRNEVGLHLFEEHTGNEAGSWALNKMKVMHKEPLLANIAPKNERSKKFFEKHGFRFIQETWTSN